MTTSPVTHMSQADIGSSLSVYFVYHPDTDEPLGFVWGDRFCMTIDPRDFAVGIASIPVWLFESLDVGTIVLYGPGEYRRETSRSVWRRQDDHYVVRLRWWGI